MHQPYPVLELVKGWWEILPKDQGHNKVSNRIYNLQNKKKTKYKTWRGKPLNQLFPSSGWVLPKLHPSSASGFLPPAFPKGHSHSSHCLCTEHDTGKGSQQPPSSYHTQTETWHTDTELQSDQDQSALLTTRIDQLISTLHFITIQLHSINIWSQLLCIELQHFWISTLLLKWKCGTSTLNCPFVQSCKNVNLN